MACLKICGITQPETVSLLAEVGVQALGLNFWPRSKRFIKPEVVAQWTLAWPPALRRVGLFVNASKTEIELAAELGFLDSLQLHGDESTQFLQSLLPLGLPLVKALSLSSEGELPDWRPWQDAGAEGLLLDAHAPGVYGGTGKTLDWQRAAEFVHTCELPVWLAGGLKPENLALAIEQVQPAWVDLASGAESAPGIQDAQRVQALAQIARESQLSNPS